jgi:hypothetical protein
VRPDRELSGEDAIFISAVADLLARRCATPSTRTGSSEVAARTREIEEQRRFTGRSSTRCPSAST